MHLLVIALLFVQTLELPSAYTTTVDVPDHLGLATTDGRFTIELGLGCDDLGPGMNVAYLPGSGGVASIQVAGGDALCNVFVDGHTSDVPCAINDAGACDVAAESDGN
jgi:hypothetical protein